VRVIAATERRGARTLLAGLVSAALLLPTVPADATPAAPVDTAPAAPGHPSLAPADAPPGGGADHRLAAGAAAAGALAELSDAAPTLADAEADAAIASQLVVTFRDGTDPLVADGAIAAAGGEGRLPAGFTVATVRVPPEGSAEAIVALTAHTDVLAVTLDRAADFATAAVDPLRDQQWWWRNEARRPRAVDIGAELAAGAPWRRGVVVAVVDTGMDVQHPDLAPNVWRNRRVGAFGCANDVNGCNFSAVGTSGQVFAGAQGDAHGTHVAGVVAAAENGAGSVGVAPRVELMSVKFLHGEQGAIGGAIQAIQYAADAGADVINASWTFDASTHAALATALDTTMRQARIPIVVAAGNDGDATTAFPASSTAPNVITVTAVDRAGRVPGFANRSSTHVDVAAPGQDILSTLPRTHAKGPHGELSGTSQAAPMVTGAVALAISASGVTDGARLASAVRAGARPLGHLGDQDRPSAVTRAGLASAPGTLLSIGVNLGACRSPAPAAPFADLARGDVHTSSVDCIVARGLAGGYPDGTYRPARTVTRGQVASFLAGLVRTAEDLPVPSTRRFGDLEGDVHRDNIEALAAIGIVDGYGRGADRTYRAGDRVTREQFASLLVRTYEHLADGRVRPITPGFADVRGSVHERNVRIAAQLGFVQGRESGRFAPRDGVTRAQLGSLLRRALDKLVADRLSG
jgi:hypothetical protein